MGTTTGSEGVERATGDQGLSLVAEVAYVKKNWLATKKSRDELANRVESAERAERAIAADRDRWKRLAGEMRVAMAALIEKCSNNDVNGHWSCWDDARAAIATNSEPGSPVVTPSATKRELSK